MLLALAATLIVLAVLLWPFALRRSRSALAALRAGRERAQALAWAQSAAVQAGLDPGRELRAERRARELLRSCVNEEEWAMYRDLGFLRVWGGAPLPGAGGAPCAYLLYPHLPLVAHLPHDGTLLGEYCVAFPDRTRPYGSTRLPDSDDVLAKWLALAADERGLIAGANMHLPGRQVSPRRVRTDLARLERWEARRAGRARPDSLTRPVAGRVLAS